MRITFADIYLVNPVELVDSDTGRIAALTILEGHYLTHRDGIWYCRVSMGYGLGGGLDGKRWHRLGHDDDTVNFAVPDSNVRCLIERDGD